MTKINFGRVVLGGIAAGILLVVADMLLYTVVMADQWRAAAEKLGLSEPDTAAIIFYSIMDVIVGIVMVWLYAAIRPRFGAGVRTAIVSGIIVWFLGLFWYMANFVADGTLAGSLVFMTLLWGLIVISLAAVLGAWIYKEE